MYSPVLKFLPHFKQNFRVFAELSLLCLGVLKVTTLLCELGGKIGADPSCIPDIVYYLQCCLLNLRYDLDCGRSVSNDCNSLACPITILIPKVRVRLEKQVRSFSTISRCEVDLL